MSEYIKRTEILQYLTELSDRHEEKMERLEERIKTVKAGGEDRCGRTLEWLEKCYEKHDKQDDEIIKILEHVKYM